MVTLGPFSGWKGRSYPSKTSFFVDVLPWEDVRGETALLHFLASSSLQRGDKKGQEVQQFQVWSPKELGQTSGRVYFFDLVLNRFRWVEKKMCFFFGGECDFMLSWLFLFVVRLYESRWI